MEIKPSLKRTGPEATMSLSHGGRHRAHLCSVLRGPQARAVSPQTRVDGGQLRSGTAGIAGTGLCEGNSGPYEEGLQRVQGGVRWEGRV